MALCDRLEAARAEREATRDRLAAASLARLNAPDPETFRDDARFALDALPALTARPVTKVDELMALCDHLEASLATADEFNLPTPEALLADALALPELVDRQAAE